MRLQELFEPIPTCPGARLLRGLDHFRTAHRRAPGLGLRRGKDRPTLSLGRCSALALPMVRSGEFQQTRSDLHAWIPRASTDLPPNLDYRARLVLEAHLKLCKNVPPNPNRRSKLVKSFGPS